MKTTSKYVLCVDDMPLGEHWAIIENNSVYIPGDERSRTDPGHGYPESTERYISYRAFTNRAEFEEEFLRCLESANREFRQIRGIYVLGSYVAQPKITLIPPRDGTG